LLLAIPPTVTTTGPDVTPAGTGAITVIVPHVVGVAVTPLKVIVLVPWGFPNIEPLTVMLVPTAPLDGLRPVITGFVTVKVTALLAMPVTVTITGPVVAAAGTGTVMLVGLQAVGDPATPLNVTVLLP